MAGTPQPRTCARRSAAGDRGEDRHLVAVGHWRVETVQETDVLAADVDVDEPAQPAILGDAAAQLAVAVVKGVEHLADGLAVDARRRLAVGGGSELGWDLDRDCHGAQCYHATATTRSAASSKDSRVGSISQASNVPRATSSVFSPSPVM